GEPETLGACRVHSAPLPRCLFVQSETPIETYEYVVRIQVLRTERAAAAGRAAQSIERDLRLIGGDLEREMREVHANYGKQSGGRAVVLVALREVIDAAGPDVRRILRIR